MSPFWKLSVGIWLRRKMNEFVYCKSHKLPAKKETVWSISQAVHLQQVSVGIKRFVSSYHAGVPVKMQVLNPQALRDLDEHRCVVDKDHQTGR
jgi:hypothetical protein